MFDVNERLKADTDARLASIKAALEQGKDIDALREIDAMRRLVVQALPFASPLYSPGPYEVYAFDGDSIGVRTLDGRSICDMVGNFPVDLANARLLAHAPSMIDVLKTFVRVINAAYSNPRDLHTLHPDIAIVFNEANAVIAAST